MQVWCHLERQQRFHRVTQRPPGASWMKSQASLPPAVRRREHPLVDPSRSLLRARLRPPRGCRRTSSSHSRASCMNRTNRATQTWCCLMLPPGRAACRVQCVLRCHRRGATGLAPLTLSKCPRARGSQRREVVLLQDACPGVQHHSQMYRGLRVWQETCMWRLHPRFGRSAPPTGPLPRVLAGSGRVAQWCVLYLLPT